MNSITNSILLIQPRGVRANEQTASNNHYQKSNLGFSPAEVETRTTGEFNAFVAMLEAAGVRVMVFNPADELDTPDAHFPNNWLSTHASGNVLLYPMFAPNRRKERRPQVLDFLKEHGFDITSVQDHSSVESDQTFLEGTGSLVLDRSNKLAYCAISERSSLLIAEKICGSLGYALIAFEANQWINHTRVPIYHTNVMMSIASTYALVCLSCIDDQLQRQFVLTNLARSGKEIILINPQQVEAFVGNTLQVTGANGQAYAVMSSRAYEALRPEQIERIEAHNPILHTSLETIENLGGGSARCMMTEVFLPQIKPDK